MCNVMENIDFSKITACGECCAGCRKKEEGICEGCIESDGHCKEWAQSGQCPVHKCAREHGVRFCGLCAEFPCGELTKKIHWNPKVIEHLTELAKAYHDAVASARIKMYKQAEKYFNRLDNNTKERIKEGIKGLLEIPPVGNIKELKGEFQGLSRLQIGGFRIIYFVEGEYIKITNIFPRGDVYKRI